MTSSSSQPGRIRFPANIRTRWRRLPIETQLAILFLVALPLVWGLVAAQVFQLQRLALKETEKELSNLAHAFSEQVYSSAATIDLSLIGLRAHWVRHRGEFRDVVGQLQRHLHDDLAFQVSVTDAAGRLVFSSLDPNAPPLELGNREHFAQQLDSTADRLHISEPVLNRVSQQLSIQFTRPIRDRDGTPAGVIALSVSPEYFTRIHDDMEHGAGVTVTLVREGGVILARSPNPPATRNTLLAGPPYDNASVQASGIYRGASRIDGEERLFAWRTLPRFGLVVTTGRPLQAVRERYAEQRDTYLVAGVVITFLLVAVGFVLLTGARHRSRANAELAESEARWKFALEASDAGVWDWCVDPGTVQLSRRSREILHIDQAAVPGTPQELYKHVHPEDLPAVTSAIQAHLEGKTPNYHLEHRVHDGRGGWSWILARGMVAKRDASGKPLRMVGTFSDITERKLKEASVAHQASHDALTGLPNRPLFFDRLRQALARARREQSQLAVLFFDLDRFKPVNDTWGHRVGDLLLKAVARRVEDCLRESDTVARVGGDEFVVLLPRVASEDDAVCVAESIRKALEQPFTIEGHLLEISCCVGVATYPSHAGEAETLVRMADAAMYAAKASGRNSVKVNATSAPA